MHFPAKLLRGFYSDFYTWDADVEALRDLDASEDNLSFKELHHHALRVLNVEAEAT